MEKVKAISTKILTKDLIKKNSILCGTRYFYSGILQNYSVIIPAKKCIKYFGGTTEIYLWKSNGMSEESIENIIKVSYLFTPTLVNYYPLPCGKINEYCLLSNNISITKKVINLYISYALDQRSRDLNTDFVLGNCLFGSVELTNDTDPDKYKYRQLLHMI